MMPVTTDFPDGTLLPFPSDYRQPMTLPAACRWLGCLTGKMPATSTMWRWTLKGVRGGVRLESFRIGGTTYTTPEMIGRFIERTSRSGVVASVSPDGISVSKSGANDGQREQRREEIAAAQERLKEMSTPKRPGRKPK